MIRSMQEEERVLKEQGDVILKRRGEAGVRRKEAEEQVGRLVVWLFVWFVGLSAGQPVTIVVILYYEKYVRLHPV